MNILTVLRPRRRWLWQLGVPLLILAAVVFYFTTAPLREEQVLKHASLLELQVDAQQDANDPRIFYYLGLRAQQAGQKELALDSLGRAATQSPHDEAMWLAWARAAAAIQGSQAAIDILNTFLQVHPHSAETHLMLAQIFSELGRHARSYAEAKAAVQQSPRNERAWRLCGKEALKNYDAYASEDAFRRAIALAPGDWEDRQGLGDALFASSRYAEATNSYREAIRLNQSAGVAYLTLGQTLLHTANSATEIEAARQSLRQALARRETLTSDGLFLTYLSLGQSYSAEKRWQEALPLLQQAVPYEPTDVTVSGDVHFELARVYRGLNDAAGAAREMSLHTKRALYSVQLKQWSNRIRTRPDDAQAYLSLARLYAEHGNDDNAVYLYRQALIKAPDLKAAQQELAALLRRHPANSREETP